MVIVFYGEDEFRMRLEVRERISDSAKKEPARIKTFEIADEKDLEEIFAFLSAAELWQEKKIATAKFFEWSRDLAKTLKNEAEKRNNFDANILFVLAPRGGNGAKIANAEYKLFPLLAGRALASWIQNTAAKFGNTIDAPALRAVSELHGRNTENIWNELLLLSCWKPGGKIETNDIAVFRKELPAPEDFALVETMAAGNRKDALRLLYYELMNGKPPLMILGSITAYFRAMLVAKFSENRGEDDAANKFFARNHPFWVSNIARASRRFSEDEILRAFRKLWRIDRAAKTGEHKPEMLLEEFIIGA